MVVRPHGLAVMKHTESNPSTTQYRPAPAPLISLLLTVALLAAVVVALVAITYPVAALVTAAVALTATGAARTIHRRRVRAQRARHVCIPHTDVCLLL